MNEEYLWNKSGSDPEIEQLEEILKTFRSSDSRPLLNPSMVLISDKAKKTQINWLRPLFAFGAGSFALVGLVLVSIAIYRVDFSGELAHERGVRTIGDTIKSGQADQSREVAAAGIEKDIALSVKSTGQKPNRGRRLRRYRNGKTGVSRRRAERKPVLLTKEEKYAYDQLMLGLSITSANLKIVKDKVEGTED